MSEEVNEEVQPTPVPELVKQGAFTGITGDLSNEQYHKAPGMNFSALKRFAVIPAEYQAYLREDKAPTDDQRLGTLVHMRVLEPDVFEERVVAVDGVWSHKTKERVLELRAEGKFPAKPAEIDRAKVMAESILSHVMVRRLFESGVAEQSCFWREPIEVRDEQTGEITEEEVLCKCRPDWLRQQDGIIVDLKWFNDLSDRALMKQIYRMKYHWQSKWYLNGVGRTLGEKLNMFVHVFIQEKDPYECRVIVLNDATLEKAEAEYLPQLPKYVQCLKTNVWPGYPEEIHTLSLPDYAWGEW